MMISTPVLILFLLIALLIYFIHRIVTRRPKTWKKDLLIYFLVAPLTIAALIGFFLYLDTKGVNEGVRKKWMDISATAVSVFGLTVKRFWRHRQESALWVVLGVLVLAHFILWQRFYWETRGYFLSLLAVSLSEMFVVFLLMGLVFGKNIHSDLRPDVDKNGPKS